MMPVIERPRAMAGEYLMQGLILFPQSLGKRFYGNHHSHDDLLATETTFRADSEIFRRF